MKGNVVNLKTFDVFDVGCFFGYIFVLPGSDVRHSFFNPSTSGLYEYLIN